MYFNCYDNKNEKQLWHTVKENQKEENEGEDKTRQDTREDKN